MIIKYRRIKEHLRVIEYYGKDSPSYKYELLTKIGINSPEICCHNFALSYDYAWELDFGKHTSWNLIPSMITDRETVHEEEKVTFTLFIFCPFCGEKVETKL